MNNQYPQYAQQQAQYQQQPQYQQQNPYQQQQYYQQQPNYKQYQQQYPQQYNQYQQQNNPYQQSQNQYQPSNIVIQNQNNQQVQRQSYSKNNYSTSKATGNTKSREYVYNGPNALAGSGDEIQRKFIQKVLGIICIQLSVTVVFILMAVFLEPFRWFLLNFQILLIVAIVGSIVCFFWLHCFRESARTVPKNYILLFTFTLCESYIIAFTCVLTEPLIILVAAVATTVYVGGLIAYAVYTKKDITTMGGIIFYMYIGVMILILLGALFPSRILSIIICVAILGMFSFMLVYQIQLLKGKGKYKYSIDDYIIAALDIYYTIIVLFKTILRLIGLI